MTFPKHHMVEYDQFDRALNNAVFWQNRCCELEEIIELLCLDAEGAISDKDTIAVLKAKLALFKNQAPIGYVGG